MPVYNCLRCGDGEPAICVRCVDTLSQGKYPRIYRGIELFWTESPWCVWNFADEINIEGGEK